jgi:hypothetical protein
MVRELDDSKYEVIAGARRLTTRQTRRTGAHRSPGGSRAHDGKTFILWGEALGFKSLLELGEPAYTNLYSMQLVP